MEPIRRYELSAREKQHHSFGLKRMEEIYRLAGGKTDAPHRHDFYTIIWLQRGTGVHHIDFVSYPLSGNQIFFLSPGKVHQLDTPTEPFGWVMTFSREFLMLNHIEEDFLLNINLFRDFGETPPLEPDQVLVEKLDQIMVDMAAWYQDANRFSYRAIGSLLQLFLIHCNQICTLHQGEPEGMLSGAGILRQFRAHVEEQFRSVHKVGEYAEKQFITAKYLNQVVRSLTGKTAKELIQDRIVLEAKRMLRYSEDSIKEIAYALGYEEPLHFSGFFKKCTGLSPSAFRKANPI